MYTFIAQRAESIFEQVANADGYIEFDEQSEIAQSYLHSVRNEITVGQYASLSQKYLDAMLTFYNKYN